jgi:hypothetical protein
MGRLHRLSYLVCCCLLLVPVLVLAGPQLPTDEPPAQKAEEKAPDLAPPTAKELADKRMAFMKSALAHFTIQVGDRKEPAQVGDPCLRWTDPVSNAADGVVAVYAHNGGRPDAIAQFFFNFQKKWIAEFTIIPDGDVTILRSGREHWKPSEYVCQFTDLPGSPVPAARAALRLPQMRAIAADFAVIDYFGVQPVKQNLRLLPQPVYRYSEDGKIVDGAVFIFAHGTNPECCVLLEAYHDGKGARYRYAVAPMSIYQLEARYKDAPVWSVERRPTGRRARSYYADAYTPDPGETLPE